MKIERWDFNRGELQENDLLLEPLKLFKQWYEDAVSENVQEPSAVVVATVLDGQVATRVVYLRDILEEGLVFYTNYESQKGKAIEQENRVAMNFHWSELERQVKVKGIAEKVPAEVSDQYFSERPRLSQLGAWASNQSSVIANREELILRMEEFENKFDGQPVPRPENWGGYVVKPTSFEFWQGRPGRLHDRFLFTSENDVWKVNRLSP
ncbi:MAG TPA: pyridoxamine 5'-phosphate oxidase [Flavobacteriales bacterium]|jgi:pyridoxamine 5'-phosphate oxidase|nr:pyridoxamine 5'-phosphate oxidase [Salibacteraceae bacterium]HAS36099.1 pyridoxamine 5'-phosphate oxidase [Flavobacteriales bacterium]